MANPAVFQVGDMILVGHVNEKQRAIIQSMRCTQADARSIRANLGADVITELGECRFYFMSDICRWNPNKVREAFSS